MIFIYKYVSIIGGLDIMENKWQLCVCGILRFQDKYLLIQRNPFDENMAGFWEMPSGKLEFGEKVEEGLIREVYEEVGININNLAKSIVGISEYASHKNDVNKYSVQLNYLVDVPTIDLSIKLSDEHIDYAWVEKDDMRIDEFIAKIINDAEELFPSYRNSYVKRK